MFEHIDPRSPVPLWEQIAARVRVAIAAGDLLAGEALPSVRELAKRLRVNPATVAQAYRELGTEDFVESRHGAGTFVKEVAAEKRSLELNAQAGDLVRRLLEDGARMGISASDLAKAFKEEVGRTAHD
jgi:GntR family transcriptional regulator